MTEQQDGASGGNNTAIPFRREPDFIPRVLIFYGVGVLFLLVVALFVYASNVVLLVFSAILIAILLNDASRALARWFPLSHGIALVLVLALVVAVLIAGGWFLAPQAVSQVNQLVADLPAALQRLREYLESHPTLKEAVGMLPPPDQMLKNTSSLMAQAGSVFSGLLGSLGNLVFILFVAIYLAAQPGIYTRGVIKLLPPQRRGRGRAVVEELGTTLSLWLRGKLLSMLVVGTVTGIGLTLLDVPLALALGVVAGLFDFIPYIGPIFAAVPAVLIAFSQSPTLALYVVILFAGVQMLEGYLLAPLIDRKMVSLPPALTITMQVLMGLAFGLIGIALATPLTAVIAVTIAMLYVEDVLDDQVELPGDAK
ncbi:MAG TPA: AI-2E family transporter [Noviherbaspirillum sp.]